MNNQITHAFILNDSKVSSYEECIRKHAIQILSLEESIAEDRMKWDEGNTYRIQHETPDDQELEWQIPAGKMRMDAIMRRIQALSRRCSWLKEDMQHMQISLQRLLQEAVPVPEAPNGSDTVENNETAFGTCCPGAEQATGDSSSSDDEDDDDE